MHMTADALLSLRQLSLVFVAGILKTITSLRNNLVQSNNQSDFYVT